MKFFSAMVDPMAAAWQPEHLSRVGTPAKVPSARNAWQSSHLAPALSAWTWWLKSTGCCCVLRSEEHTSELQSLRHLVCRLLLEKKKKQSTLEAAQLSTPCLANSVSCARRA